MCMFSDRSDCVDGLTPNDTNVTTDDAIFILGGVLKRESWVLPMLVVSAINVTVILAFEVFVVCKAARFVIKYGPIPVSFCVFSTFSHHNSITN